MISKEEIKKLAELARIEIEEDELERLRSEIAPILDYVSQVKKVAGNLEDEVRVGSVFNVMREDESADWRATESGTYTDALLAEAPETEKGFIKVKKIL